MNRPRDVGRSLTRRMEWFHGPNECGKTKAELPFIAPDVALAREIELGAAGQRFGILASYNESPLSHCLLRALSCAAAWTFGQT